MSRSEELREFAQLTVALERSNTETDKFILGNLHEDAIKRILPFEGAEDELFEALCEAEKRIAENDQLSQRTKELSAEVEELHSLLEYERAKAVNHGTKTTKEVPTSNAFIEMTPLRIFQEGAGNHLRQGNTKPADPTTAYVMACLSEIAYLAFPGSLGTTGRYKLIRPSITAHALAELSVSIDLPAILRLADLDFEVIDRERFTYIIYRFGNVAVIAVRGTVWWSIRDWLLDFDARKTPANIGTYHKGFFDEASDACRHDLYPKLEETKIIYFTGHSLGAAVASILAQIWPRQTTVMKPFVFASPRFGSREATSQTERYGYRRPFDPVPHLPPAFTGFSHRGTTDDVIREDRLVRGLLSPLSIFGLGLPHHSIEGIRKRLGDRIGFDFADSSYIDAIKDQMN